MVSDGCIQVSDDKLVQLGKTLEGELKLNDPAAPEVPPVWNGLLKGTESPILPVSVPRCYARVASKLDVVTCLQFAVQHKLKVYARGSGHHYGGACLPPSGMVLDLGSLRKISVDPVSQTATVGPGVSTRELREATIAHGLHFPGGHISDVGCSGFILGGGNGWSSTLFGCAADNVISFEVALPTSALPPSSSLHEEGEKVQTELQANEDGVRLIEVSAISYPDLFAGLKGAGSFLGIVTEFKLQLHPMSLDLPIITAIFPASLTQSVAAVHADIFCSAPPSVEVSLAFIQASQDPSHPPLVVLSATAFSLNPNDEDIQSAFDKVRALHIEQRVVFEDTVMPYLKALSVLDAAWEWPGLCLYGHGMFVSEEGLNIALLQDLAQLTKEMSSKRSLILIAPACAPSSKPSSLSFRGGYFLSAYAMWTRTEGGPDSDGDELHVGWVNKVKKAVGLAARGLYINEVMLNEEGQVQKCYSPETYEKLTTLKAWCDPHGLLRSL